MRRWVRRYEEEGQLTERVRAPQSRAINEDELSNMIATYQEININLVCNVIANYKLLIFLNCTNKKDCKN